MTDLTTSHASLCLSLSSCERREVVVENELLGALNENLIELLHIHLCTESHACKRLSLTTSEDCATMCARQITDLAPDWTHLGGVTSVETDTLVEDEVAHCSFLHCVIVSVDHHLFLLALLLRDGLHKFFLDCIEGVAACVLVLS